MQRKYMWQNRLSHWTKSKTSSNKLHENFLKLKIPALSFLVLPSKQGVNYFASEVNKYEKSIKMPQQNL